VVQVTKTVVGENKFQLEIEVDALTVKSAYESLYHGLQSKIDVPGFRKGKVPKDMLRQYVDPREFNRMLYEALVPDAYRVAVRQENFEPIESPQIQVLQLAEDQPLRFRAVVPVMPEVKLGEYKGLEVEVPKATVTEAEVNQQLEHIQQERASFDKIALKPLAEGDMVRGAVKTSKDGAPVAELTRDETLIRLGQEGLAGLSFDDMLIGKNVGDTAKAIKTIPSDYANADLAGKDVEIELEVKEAYERKTPEINDEFAAGLGDPDVTDVASLYKRIETAISEQKKGLQQNAARQAIVQKLAEATEVSVPEAMVAREVLRLAEDLLHSLEHEQMSLSDYLEAKENGAEGLFAELAEAGRFRVKRSMVLDEVAKLEHIHASEEDLAPAIQQMAQERNVKDWRMKEILREEGRLEALDYAVTQQKTLEWLADQAKLIETDADFEELDDHEGHDHD
jgi:trigger factor